jgi:diaminopimelate decarboxylase
MSLPGSPYLARSPSAGASDAEQPELLLDGCSLEALARRFGTPLFVYSQRAVLDAADAYLGALAGRPHLLCYAMKANSSLALLQTLHRAGCGFDIVSGGELERALAIGAEPSRMVFSGVGKTRAEMRRALQVGVRCFNVESEAELELLAAEASAGAHIAPVSLRINPDVDARTHPYISTGLKDNKFGIAHDRALACYKRAAELPGLKVVGIDCHIGSQITQIAPYLDALDRLLDLIEAVEAEGITLEHLDLGGGLGIDYQGETPPRPDELVAQLLRHIDARGHGQRTLMFEPGRSLVGNAGVLLTQVLYLKPAADPDSATAKNFCIVDAAMNDLLRPALYQSWMAIEPCRARRAAARLWDVVGPVCESGDWLGRQRSLALQGGDILAVLSAGAYAMSMASNYNSRARAAEVMIVEGQPQLIRRRESLESLWQDELKLD